MTEYKISLRAARVNTGMTINEVAGIIGRRPETVRNWETGRNQIPADMLIALCELYKAPIDSIHLA